MNKTWHNNRISKKLNEEYKKDFSICDIDGLVRTHYVSNFGILRTRLIIYESKNQYEFKKSKSQFKSLKLLDESINWSKFDNYSGLFLLKIIDIDDEIIWYDINDNEIRKTSFDELYKIFSCKLI